MFQLSGLLGRAANALLAAVVAFLVVFIIGALIVSFQGEIGTKLKEFAPIIGLLVGLVVFFTGRTPNA